MERHALAIQWPVSGHVKGAVSTTEIIKHARKLGLNPGGAVAIQEVEGIPAEHKNKLITDDELLMKLGSKGRSKASQH